MGLLRIGFAVMLAASIVRGQGLPADASTMAAGVIRQGAVALDGVTFEGDTATLSPAAGPVLREVVRLLDEHDEWRFEVQGHTDGTGTPAADLALSERRAGAVVSWLTAQGVAASRLVARGYGDTRPVVDNGGRVKRARIELKKLNEENDPMLNGVH